MKVHHKDMNLRTITDLSKAIGESLIFCSRAIKAGFFAGPTTRCYGSKRKYYTEGEVNRIAAEFKERKKQAKKGNK